MILWGPPGVGKTTLARLMADAFNAEFIALSAVLSGVKDIRDAVARARGHARAIGPAHDPVRRRGASLQQGAAGRLPAVRRAGLVTFIGATTENPSFEVNSALLSRAAVYVLRAAVARTSSGSCSTARCRGRAESLTIDAGGARRR